jgi:hypothetical protein
LPFELSEFSSFSFLFGGVGSGVADCDVFAAKDTLDKMPREKFTSDSADAVIENASDAKTAVIANNTINLLRRALLNFILVNFNFMILG